MSVSTQIFLVHKRDALWSLLGKVMLASDACLPSP